MYDGGYIFERFRMARKYAEKTVLEFAWKDRGKLRCLRVDSPGTLPVLSIFAYTELL